MGIRHRLSQSPSIWLFAALLLALLAVAGFYPSPTQAQQSASLTATVDTADQTVDLTINNHTGNWWFKINWWGSCTAVTGSSITGIGGYQVGTEHSVWAYSDSGCNTQIAATTFTIAPHNAGLAAHVQSDRSVNLTISNWSKDWWFRIGWGSCTAASGTTVSGIRGYKTGTYAVGAFSKSDCSGFLADANFTVPPPTASLTTTVNPGPSVDLTLTNGPNNWWFRINWWGTCTAATGTSYNNIRGYQAGTHAVTAYSDSGCNTEIASSSFTIPELVLAIAVDSSDRSVDLTLSGGPSNWWFRIGLWGNCTAATGTTVSNIRGYQSGSYVVAVYPASGCVAGDHITAESFTMPTATLTTTVNTDRSVDLTLTNGTTNWWFRINSWGTCTAAGGTTVSNIQGYKPGTHPVSAYSDGGCKYHVASSSFTLLPPTLTASGVTGTGATLTIAEHPGQWYYKADVGPDNTCQGPVASGTSTKDLTGLSPGTTYTYSAYSDSGCATLIATADAFTTASLTASGITDTGATLTIAGKSAPWYYKRTAGPADSTCNTVASGTTATLSSLTADTLYGYIAYSDSGCTTVIDTVYFSTTAYGVGNLDEMSATNTCAAGYAAGEASQCAVAFTTGGESGGYTLASITGKLTKFGSPSNLIVAIHAADTTNSSNPAATAIANATFSGSNPGTTGLYSFTCSGAGCVLSANTTYFVVMSTADTSGLRWYIVETTVADAETVHPAANGWSIANTGRDKLGTNAWADMSLSRTVLLHVAAKAAPALTVSDNTTGTSATLNLANYRGAWYVKQTALSTGTCSSEIASGTTTHILSSLTADTLYGYTAYSDSGCTTVIDTVYFSTTAYGVGNLDEMSATNTCAAGYAAGEASQCAVAFTTGGESGGYTLASITGKLTKFGSPSNLIVAIHAADTTNSSNPAATAIANATFSGSNPGTTGLYSFTCSGAGCVLSANTTYFVVMSTADTSGLRWYIVETTVADAETVHPAANGWSIANTGRDKLGTNAWADMSLSRTVLLHVAARGPTLTASAVTPTTATLTLANRTGNWWLKETAPSTGTCTAGESDFSHALTSLTGGTTYTYKAYSDSGCSTETASETFVTPVSHSNLNTGGLGTAVVDNSGAEAGVFITGGNPGGYTLESVEVRISSVTNTTGNASGDLTVTLSTSTADGEPGTVQATLVALSGGNPTGAGTYTYTCPSTANCSLSPATEYHVVLSAPNTTGNGRYVWTTVTSKTAVQEPSNNGWLVGKSHYQHSGWQNISDFKKVKATAAVNPSLTASSITSTGATLTLSHHPGAWWYKGSQANASCTPVAAGASTATLTGLTTGVSHTYKAYDASGCADADEIAAAAAFTPGSAPTFTAGTPTASKNTLTLANWNGVWSYKHANTGAVCTPVAAGTTSVNLAELAVNTSFTYTAYSDHVCSAVIAAASAFTTGNPALTVAYSGPVDNRKAVLTLTGWIAGDHRQPNEDGRWYYKYTVPDGGTCSFPRNTQTGLGIDVTVGTSYTYKAYGASNCSSTNEIASLTQVAQGPGVANSAKDISLHTDNADTDGVWTDGTTIWALDSTDDKIYAYTVATKARDTSKDFASLPGIGSSTPYGIWSDGATMWVAAGSKIYAYKMSDKSRDTSKEFSTLAGAGNHQPFGIWSDGTTMWVADYTDNKIYAYKMSDKSRDTSKEFTLNNANDNPNGIWSDGVTMWVVDHTDNKAYAYTLSSGSRVSAKDFSITAGARGLTSDDHNFYIANPSQDKLYAHYAFPALTATTVSFATATLTLTGYPDGNWWIKKTSGTPGSCTAGESDYSHALSSLTPSTSYTYKAYSDSQCQNVNELASETFTTSALPVPGSVGAQVQDTSMTTTANNQLQVWWGRPANVTGSVGYTVQCYTNVYKVCHTEAAGTGTEFKVTPSSTGVPTKVRVRTTVSGSNSAWVEVNVPSGTVPGAPTAVNSALGHGGYTMSWTKPANPTGAVGYHTQCRDSNTNWSNCGSAGSNGVIPPTSSTGVSTNVGYIFQFRVRSVVDGLVSAWVVSS